MSVPSSSALPLGLQRSLALLEDHATHRATLAKYAAVLGAPVYLRPTNQGLTVLSLDHRRCRSMIGVGGRGPSAGRLKALPPSDEDVARDHAEYLAKRDSLARESIEERFALELIADAFDDGLRIPRLGVYFLHQEWRLDGARKLDLLALDLESRRLVVVELKTSQAEAERVDVAKGGDAAAQAAAYARAIHERADVLLPYFERLARAMAAVHGAPPAMRSIVLSREPPLARVAWPRRSSR